MARLQRKRFTQPTEVRRFSRGRLHIELPDGNELEIGPGDVFEIPPGHDAWVVGEEPWVAVDFAGMRTYARPAEHRADRVLASLLFSGSASRTAASTR